MTDHRQDHTHHVSRTEIVPAHTPVTPAPHRPESMPDEKAPASIIAFPVGSKRSRLPWLIGMAIVLAIAGGGLWYWGSSGAPPVQYKTAVVDQGPITAIVTATGTINPVVSVQVGSQVSGKVSRLFADFNSQVVTGQILAQIDQKPFKARLSQARAAV